MSSYHGWTHRRKVDGGTDPIDLPSNDIWYAQLGNASATTVTTPWTVDGVVQPSDGGIVTNDVAGDYYDEVIDSNSKSGIRVLQEGIYHLSISALVTFAINTGTRILPKYVAPGFIRRTNFGTNFSGSLTHPPTAQHVNGGGVYLPDNTDLTTLSSFTTLEVKQEYIHDLRDLGSGAAVVPIDYAWKMTSWGGTEDWQFYGGISIVRLGDRPA